VTIVRWRVEEFDTIDSTNTWLKERAARGEPEGLVARADFQSAGRGRLDRVWEAPPRSSLLTSILLRPSIARDDIHLTTVAVALAARAALVRLCGVRPQLKWPNDLVVNDAKLGGVLAEAVTDDAGEFAVVVGLGLNLTDPGPDGANGTSVRALAGVTLDPRAVLDLLLEELEVRLTQMHGEERTVLRDEFVASLSTLGRHVTVQGPTHTLEGIAQDVDQSGRLVVANSAGTYAVSAGDVVHLRVAT
jgi:BirA family transcriptional regulator, biotin operon repressor / biotin---[acetyl-CoA-carboxylase] ligase